MGKMEYKEVTVDDILDQLSKDGLYIKEIDKSHQTKEMVLTALRNNGMALEFINKKYIRYDAIKIAIENNVKSCTLIPESRATHEVWLLVAKNGGYEYIPENRVTEDINLAAIEVDPSSLKLMTTWITAKVILAAIANSNNIRIITSAKAISIHVYEEVVAECPAVINCIEHISFIEEVTYDKCNELRLHLISLDAENLQYIDKFDQTYDMCASAVKSKSSTIRYVKEKYYYHSHGVGVSEDSSSGLLEDAVCDNPMNLLLTNPVSWVSRVVNAALFRQPNLLARIWDSTDVITSQAYEKCVEYNPSYVKLVKYDKMTNRIAKIAVIQKSEMIMHLGPTFQTQEIQLIAVKDDPDNITYIHFPTFKTRLVAFWEHLKRIFI